MCPRRTAHLRAAARAPARSRLLLFACRLLDRRECVAMEPVGADEALSEQLQPGRALLIAERGLLGRRGCAGGGTLHALKRSAHERDKSESPPRSQSW